MRECSIVVVLGFKLLTVTLMCDNELRGLGSCSVMFIYVSFCFIIQVIYFVEIMETCRRRKCQAMQVRPLKWYCSGIVVVL